MKFNYNLIRQRYDSTKPIRGKPHIIPLEDRRKHHMRMEKNSDESIDCILYNTRVITYRPDGTITLRTGRYASKTTAEFIDTYVSYCWLRGGVLWIGYDFHIRATTIEHKVGRWPIKDSLTLAPTNDRGHLMPIDQIVLPVWYTSSEKSKEAQNIVKPFLNFARSIYRIAGGKLKANYGPDARSFEHFKSTLYLRNIQLLTPSDFENEDNWPGLLNTLSFSTSEHYNDSSTYEDLRSRLYRYVIAPYAKEARPTLIDGTKEYAIVV